MKTSSINIFRLFCLSFASFALKLIDIFINYNINVNLTKFFRSFRVINFLFDDNVNLFCNVNSNIIFNDEIFL